MIPELDCLRKNFDVIAESIRNAARANPDPWGYSLAVIPVEDVGKPTKSSTASAAETGAAGCREDRSNPEAALKSHLEAHDNYLDQISGCDGW